MNAIPFGSEDARPIEAESHPKTASEQKSNVVRVTIADVLPPSNLRPPTAQTFEELEIPASYRQAVEKELTRDEKLLWVGRPSLNPQVHPRNPMLLMIGGGLLALAVLIVLVNLVSAVGGKSVGLIGFLFAGVLGVIGLAFLLPWLINTAKQCRYCYAVTNRRALLVELSMKGPAVQSYLPQQLVGMERKDHAAIAGAGDLVFEYVFTLPGNSINPLTGSFLQQGATAGSSRSPQRVPRGFLCLDQVRDVEDLVRTTLLVHLEQTLDAPTSAAHAPVHAASVACACGVTIEAPPALAGKSVKCPRCAAAVALAPRQIDAGAPVSCREDGPVPADLKEKTLSGLDPNEKPVWIGQPIPKLVLLRNGAFLAGGGVGILAALIWVIVWQPGSLLLPLGLLVASACVAAVALVRWHTATRTCYALTNRRALVYQESLFGPTRDSYSPLEVSNMRRSDSWQAAGSGDLIFRTVQVISRTQSRPGRSETSVKTVHYGFLAIPHLDDVEKLVRETLIDRFVDKLNQANAL